jgi:hypothetical protein
MPLLLHIRRLLPLPLPCQPLPHGRPQTKGAGEIARESVRVQLLDLEFPDLGIAFGCKWL